uniref:AlNc14C18G1911 protein n=1 Tax=Albugo laibachii Nc14 TaxID=890382 RepID=F0W4U1_9STRA|nr:AlNc14C18G1911 [Albugo laibachii Nc14]|eukprot:CCA16129.1 AlNc14C18G1911 [Albugo laibachii Nc14]
MSTYLTSLATAPGGFRWGITRSLSIRENPLQVSPDTSFSLILYEVNSRAYLDVTDSQIVIPILFQDLTIQCLCCMAM